MPRHSWASSGALGSKEYTCGHCGRAVASAVGYQSNQGGYLIYICPNCTQPSYFGPGFQLPGVAPGAEVPHLPADVGALYREARNCIAAGCNTAAVLLCRKLLMNIAVAQGAASGEPFIAYVEHLAQKGFVPPNGRAWVDHIRTKGNEANHEIALITPGDAEELVTFLEMLLKFIYEFPMRVPQPRTP